MAHDRRTQLTVAQLALIRRAAEFAEHLGTPGRLPPLVMQFVATVTIHGNPNAVLRPLREDRWVRVEQDEYVFDVGDLPTKTDHLKGGKPASIPDNGIRNAALHWKAGERSLSETQMLEPPKPAPAGRKDDRLVATSVPPSLTSDAASGKKKAPAASAPAAPSSPVKDVAITAEGIDAILVAHLLAEEKNGGPLNLADSGEAFRGKVSETNGYAARMKLKRDGLYEPVHVNAETVRWRVTEVGRARVAGKLAAAKAPPSVDRAASAPPPLAPVPPPPVISPSPVPLAAAPQRTAVATPIVEIKMSGITHEPSTWPARPLEAGGSLAVAPASIVNQTDDVDTAIVSLCRGRPDWATLRGELLKKRRLTADQVAGISASISRAAKKAGVAPTAPAAAPKAASAPKPAPPAVAKAPLPVMAAPAPMALPPTEPQSEVVGLNGQLFRARMVIRSLFLGTPNAEFTTAEVGGAIRGSGVTMEPGQVVFRLKKAGLLVELGDAGGPGRAKRYRQTDRPFRDNGGEDEPVITGPSPIAATNASAPVPTPPTPPAPVPVAAAPPVSVEPSPVPTPPVMLPPVPQRRAAETQPSLPPPIPASPAPARYSKAIPEEAIEIGDLEAELAELGRRDQNDIDLIIRVERRRRVRRAKRNGIIGRLAELKAKNGIL